MKILHIPTGGLGSDGISKFIIDTMQEMSATNPISFQVVSPEEIDYDLKTVLDQGKICVDILGGRKKNPVAYFFKLLTYLKNGKFDIIHVHGSSSLMTIELLAAKITGIKVRVAHSHNTTCDQKKIHNFLKPVFHRLYTVALACGHDAGRWLFENREFNIVYNGRNLEKFKFSKYKREHIRRKHGFFNDELVIGHVGHFNKQKNHDFLIDVFNDLSKINSKARLLLIGSGSLENPIREKISKFELDQKVEFLGNITNVHDYYSVMDLLLFPSIYEGFPLVLIETQTNGLEAIISDKITKEVALTDKIKFLSISAGTGLWINSILETDVHRNNNSSSEQVLEQFDIKNTARLLYEYYCNLQ